MVGERREVNLPERRCKTCVGRRRLREVPSAWSEVSWPTRSQGPQPPKRVQPKRFCTMIGRRQFSFTFAQSPPHGKPDPGERLTSHPSTYPYRLGCSGYHTAYRHIPPKRPRRGERSSESAWRFPSSPSSQGGRRRRAHSRTSSTVGDAAPSSASGLSWSIELRGWLRGFRL